MIRMAWCKRKVDIPLPFLPNAAGENIFTKAGLMEDLHPLDVVEICTVAKGVCDIEQQGRMVRLKAGESLYKMPGEHRRKVVVSPGGANIYWATFEGENAAKFMASFDYPPGVLHTGECPTALYEELFQLFYVDTDAALRRMVACYVDLIALLPGGAVKKTDREEQLFLQVMQMIHKHFGALDFNVNLLATVLEIHRTTLLRLFKRWAGTTPQEVIMRERLNHALNLLARTNTPVGEVATSSGFSRGNYFARVIRRHCGMSPEEYRRAAQTQPR